MFINYKLNQPFNSKTLVNLNIRIFNIAIDTWYK